MEIGEKYLVVEILGGLKVAAFPNKDKNENNNQPNFKGNGVAVWVNKKQVSQPVLEDPL